MVILSAINKNISQVINFLNQKQIVAAPTETAYGLLADATSPAAVKKVEKIKGRRAGKAIALLVSDMKMAKKYGRFSPLALKLANQHWPGPLTLVVSAKGKLASGVRRAGYVGMRVPKHKWLRLLIKKFNYPLTATSANISGQKNLYSSQEIVKKLQPRGLKFLVDGGRLPKRSASTVVKITGQGVTVLRAGAIKLKISNH